MFINSSMDFARKQLEKYGWKEGEGLGKNKSGISKALRPKFKFDTGGLGHDVYEDINNTWWERLYDEAAKNIVTKKVKDDIVLETVENSIEITTKKKKSKKSKKSAEDPYVNFVKTSELDDNIERKLMQKNEDEELEVKKMKMTSRICDLTDEELFKICGGRAAHKGARHSINMKAKLARIEMQENSLNLKISEAYSLEKKVKKFKKSKKIKE